MSLHRLTTLTLGVPNPEAVGRYYEEFGLAPLGDGRFATIDGGEQLNLVHAPQRQAVEIGLGVDGPDKLDRIAASLASFGVQSVRDAESLCAVEEGTGVRVRVQIADRIEQASSGMPALNGPGELHRTNARAEGIISEDPLDFRPRKLGHVVVASVDQPRSQAFFTEGIGFKVSDQVKGRAAFLRCSTDHHNLLIQAGPTRFMHHTSWQLPHVDAVGRAAMAMIEADEDRHVWGLGRHFIGSNFFWYLKDPAGNYSEYYSDMDVIIDDELWQPGEWEGPKSFYSWGPPPPEKMFKPEDLAALMVGAHSA